MSVRPLGEDVNDEANRQLKLPTTIVRPSGGRVCPWVGSVDRNKKSAMCTATIIRPANDSIRPNGAEQDDPWLLRIVFNRDEGRKRPEGSPPEERKCTGVRCLMPVDPVSDGTWIAANQFGLAFFLLNHYPADHDETKAVPNAYRSVDRPSRGTIIPRVVPARSLDEAHGIMEAMTVESFAGFRLVIADANSALAFSHRPDDSHIDARSALTFPQLYVSSGLGDELVEKPRRALFDEIFVRAGDPIEQQLAYQRHSWLDAPHVSVCMRRKESCTVSQTIVDLFARRVRMTYLPGPPDEDPPVVESTLGRAGD